MVLILDRAISTRAERLRDAIIDMHIPAAFTSITNGRNLLPALFIVTFADAVDEIRRMICYEDVPVVVYGGGLVHHALCVLQIAEYDALLSYIRAEVERSLQRLGMVRDGNVGCFLPNGIYLTSVGAFFRNMPLYLSKRECEVLRYLAYAQMVDPEWYVPARHIWKYVFPRKHTFSTNTVSAQIGNLNAKAIRNTDFSLISLSRREGGYRFAPHLPQGKKAFAELFLFKDTEPYVPEETDIDLPQTDDAEELTESEPK